MPVRPAPSVSRAATESRGGSHDWHGTPSTRACLWEVEEMFPHCSRIEVGARSCPRSGRSGRDFAEGLVGNSIAPAPSRCLWNKACRAVTGRRACPSGEMTRAMGLLWASRSRIRDTPFHVAARVARGHGPVLGGSAAQCMSWLGSRHSTLKLLRQ